MNKTITPEIINAFLLYKNANGIKTNNKLALSLEVDKGNISRWLNGAEVIRGDLWKRIEPKLRPYLTTKRESDMDGELSFRSFDGELNKIKIPKKNEYYNIKNQIEMLSMFDKKIDFTLAKIMQVSPLSYAAYYKDDLIKFQKEKDLSQILQDLDYLSTTVTEKDGIVSVCINMKKKK